jgi:hypothetical protein
LQTLFFAGGGWSVVEERNYLEARFRNDRDRDWGLKSKFKVNAGIRVIRIGVWKLSLKVIQVLEWSGLELGRGGGVWKVGLKLMQYLEWSGSGVEK